MIDIPPGKTPCPAPNPSVSVSFTQPKLLCLHPKSHNLVTPYSVVQALYISWHLPLPRHKGHSDFIAGFTLPFNTFQPLLRQAGRLLLLFLRPEMSCSVPPTALNPTHLESYLLFFQSLAYCKKRVRNPKSEPVVNYCFNSLNLLLYQQNGDITEILT